MQAASSGCAAGQFIETRYEALCEDVHGTLHRLDAFCKIQPSQRDHTHLSRTRSSRYDKREDIMDSAQLVEIETVIGPQF